MPNDLTPSTARQSVSPDVVDRLFQKFAVMYGKHWLDLWAGIPMQLERMPMRAIQLAVQHIEVNNKFPPTLPEFRSLCEQFKPRETPRLALADNRRAPMPQAFKDVLAKLRAK
jgi:hypothetical protein